MDMETKEAIVRLFFDNGYTVKSLMKVYEKGMNDLLDRIEKELSTPGSSTEYECLDGTKIHTDVGYVSDWFKEYSEKIRKEIGENQQ